jgi:hypothetical protein
VGASLVLVQGLVPTRELLFGTFGELLSDPGCGDSALSGEVFDVRRRQLSQLGVGDLEEDDAVEGKAVEGSLELTTRVLCVLAVVQMCIRTLGRIAGLCVSRS